MRWCRRGKWTGLCLGLVGGTWSVTAAAGPSAAVGEAEPPPPGVGVYGGNAVSACEWPTTVSLGGCTGTLVHPQVVIYAAHCGGVSEVFFGDSIYAQGRSVAPEHCQTYPGGGPGGGNDWAFCVLSEPVTDIPITPPLMGCETELLTPGRAVWIVGFGNTDDGNFGIKYEAQTELQYIQNDEAFVGGNGVDTCQGDSGGPVYVQVQDGTWRAFGITSYGDGCGGGGWYSMMHTGMSWFESASGIDLTPCHDAQGGWDPGPDCKGFPLDPMVGQGSWPACQPGAVGGWSSTCGEPFVDEPVPDDLTPPTVSLREPADGSRFESDASGRVSLTVRIDADDGDGAGLDEIQLLVDGNALAGADLEPPWEFDLVLGPGAYELSAMAIDRADNSAQSPVVRIGVDQDPPAAEDPPDGSGDGGSDDDGLDDGESAQGDALPPGFGLDNVEPGCACSTRDDPRGLPLGSLALLLLAMRRRSRRPRWLGVVSGGVQR